jgi:hypothetical protein
MNISGRGDLALKVVAAATLVQDRVLHPRSKGSVEMRSDISPTPPKLEMHRNFPQPPAKLTFSEALSLLGTRAAIAGRLVGGVARAVADTDRMGELWHRLQDYDHYDRFRSATAAPRKAFVGRTSESGPFSLLVTSNSGLYLLDNEGWHCLLRVICFGIARHQDTLYIGAAAGLHSFIISAQIVGRDSIDALRDVKVLARYETRYQNERIHQIAYDPRANLIYGANCRRNSLIAVDPGGRGIVDEKFLFVDPSGSPFFTDQNHVNAVTVNGDALLFAVRYAGAGSGLGFVANNIVRVYLYPAVGVHDVVIHDGGIMFTDSFRERDADQNHKVFGAVRFRGEEHLTQSIDAGSRNMVLRGLAMRGSTIAVGFSAFARREERVSTAGGGIIALRGDKSVGIIDGPFGQVYDVLPVDGARTDAPGPARSVDELDFMFRRDVGPLLFEAPLVLDAKMGPLR